MLTERSTATREPAAASARDPVAARRSRALSLAFIVVTVLAGGALFLSGFALGAERATTPGTPVDERQAFQPFWDTYRAITDGYAGGEVDRKRLVDGAIRGMIAALDDPFSAYLSPDQLRESLQGLAGQFEGIGARVEARRLTGAGACPVLGSGCAMVVVEPIEGSPAELAGLLAGDVISAVDGTSIDGLTIDAALKRVRGPKGTAVALTIVRGQRAPFQLTIVRAVIVQQEVTTRTLGGGAVGYVRLVGFSDRAAADFSAAVAAHVGAGRTRLIVDLRGNPGGYVTDAQKVISQFVAAGTTIFWQEDAASQRVATTALGGGTAIDPKVRLVVLIDGGTASASEIVAAAFQDLGRATLVGSASFGKGTIQVWQQLADDNGGFRLTVARWLTPSGRSVNGVGVQPDVPVDRPPGTPDSSDPALDRALEILGDGSSVGPFADRAA